MSVLGRVWRFLVGVKDALVLLFLLLFFGVLWSALSSRGPAVSVPSGAALVVDLEGVLVDQATPLSPIAALGDEITREIEVRDLTRALNRAAKDDRIKAVVLDLDGFLGGGLANLEAVGRSLNAVKAAKKPVYAYATVYGDDGYYLAAHASESWVNPMGGVFLSGPGGTGLYFREALDKLKVDVEVFRVGSFKSAVEPFTRADASPEARAADQALADDLWATYRAGVAEARPGLELAAVLESWPARVKGLNSDLATLAVDSKLVDRKGNRLAFIARVRETVGEGKEPGRADDFNGIDFRDYAAARLKDADRDAPVAIVHVAGTIVDGEAPEGQSGGTSVADLIEEAAANDTVKAIVLRISSPGGSATASEVIREAALAAKAKGKPVVASMGPVAASGGYWVSTAADKVFAERSTITGSIGVFGIIPTFRRTLSDLGITADGVGTTPYSGQPNIVQGLNEPARDMLQASVEDIYRQFIGIVAEARNLPAADVEKIAEGRVWSGAQAGRLKLVDSFGGLDAAVAEAGRLAKIEGEVRSREFRAPRPFLQQLIEDMGLVRVRRVDPHAVTMEASRLRLFGGIRAVLVSVQGPTIQAACLSCSAHLPGAVQRVGASGMLEALMRRLSD